jgi:hypothetical protein
MKLNDSKWLAAAEVKKEAVLTGEIKSINTEKQRFYYHRYILVYVFTLQTETKLIKAKKIIPLKDNIELDSFSIGEVIRIYGSWEGNHFYFNEFQLVHIDKR